MTPTSPTPTTATEARHALPYFGAVDTLLAYANAGYEGTHAYRGRHAEPYDFAADEAAWAVRCIYADPLMPWPKHAQRVAV